MQLSKKYDLGKGHVVQGVVTSDSKAIWEKKNSHGEIRYKESSTQNLVPNLHVRLG